MKSQLCFVGFALATIEMAEKASAAQAVVAPHTMIVPATAAPGPPPTRLAADVEPPPPAVPHPQTANGIVEDAGTGSSKAYARAGVLELGGFGNLAVANNFTSIQIAPTIGWFIIDNLELSAIFGLNYVHQTFDLPLGGTTLRPQDDSQDPRRAELSPPLQPHHLGLHRHRLGARQRAPRRRQHQHRFRLRAADRRQLSGGEVGLFTPAFYMDYTTGETLQTSGGNIIGVNAIYGVSAGYTVMW